MPEIERYTPAQLEVEVQTLAENYRGAVSEIEEDNTIFNDISNAIIAKDGGSPPAKEDMADRIDALPTGGSIAMGIDVTGWFLSNDPSEDEGLTLAEDIDGIYLAKEVV